MNLMVNPVITDFRQDVNGDIKMLKLGANKEDAWTNIAEQGAKAKLENNKTATINVSTYTEPVVVTPTSGKDGMKKATITLSNIPSGGTSAIFYAWSSEGNQIYYTLSATPSVGDKVYYEVDTGNAPSPGNPVSIKSVGEGTITIEESEQDVVLTRTSVEDITYSKS